MELGQLLRSMTVGDPIKSMVGLPLTLAECLLCRLLLSARRIGKHVMYKCVM